MTGKMDRIVLKGMSFYGYHGTTKIEREKGRRFYIDAEITLDLTMPGKSDRLSDAVDYKKLYLLVKRAQSKKKYHLLEALAGDIASGILAEFRDIKDVTIKVRKPRAPVGGPIEYAEVEINRGRKKNAK